MMSIDRTQLLGKAKVRYTQVTLPDGSSVRLRSLSEKEKSAYETNLLNRKGGLLRLRLEDAKRRLIILCAVDDDGKQLLSNSDMAALESMDGAITSILYNAARQHCGFEEDEVETQLKNSERISIEDSQ